MAKGKAWRVHKKNITEKQARDLVKKLQGKGKVWGKTLTTTNIGPVFTVWVK